MTQKLYICTYFDKNFLPRGLALFNSIKKYHSDFILFALTFDNESFIYLQELDDPNIIPISNIVYDSYFKTSIDKYPNKKQYFFSATPNICIYLLDKYPVIDILLYLDADVYLFNSLNPLYEEFGNNSIGICPHRLHPLIKLITKNHGVYNVGVNLFRNDEIGKKCLNDWKSDCDSWYQGKPGYSLKYFSDQIFLDSWPGKYPQLKVIQNIGVDVAPWNATNYNFLFKNGKYYVNSSELILFHFSGLQKIDQKTWNVNLVIYLASARSILKKIYIEYLRIIDNDVTPVVYKIESHRKLGKIVFYSLMKFFYNERIKLP